MISVKIEVSYSIHCPVCGKENNVFSWDIGGVVRCSHCNKRVQTVCIWWKYDGGINISKLAEEDLIGAKLIEIDGFRDPKTSWNAINAEYIIIEKDGIKYKIRSYFTDDWYPMTIERLVWVKCQK